MTGVSNIHSRVSVLLPVPTQFEARNTTSSSSPENDSTAGRAEIDDSLITLYEASIGECHTTCTWMQVLLPARVITSGILPMNDIMFTRLC